MAFRAVRHLEALPLRVVLHDLHDPLTIDIVRFLLSFIFVTLLIFRLLFFLLAHGPIEHISRYGGQVLGHEAKGTREALNAYVQYSVLGCQQLVAGHLTQKDAQIDDKLVVNGLDGLPFAIEIDLEARIAQSGQDSDKSGITMFRAGQLNSLLIKL